MHWEIIDTGVNDAETNMAIDKKLLEDMQNFPRAIFHTYQWKRPSITYGYFSKPEKWLNLAAVEELDIDIARRITGGGITLHMYDIAFSVLVPCTHPAYSISPLNNYAFVNQALIKAISICVGDVKPVLLHTDKNANIEACGCFCMSRPTKYDVIINGRKVGGAAQRRTEAGFLHHGSIAIEMPNRGLLKKILLDCDTVAQAMQLHTYPLIGIDRSTILNEIYLALQ